MKKARARRAGDECILVLQGGGALGAYQAGVYEALAARRMTPDWVAGISIGAINAALIAGNPPEQPRRAAARVLGDASRRCRSAPRCRRCRSACGARDVVNETSDDRACCSASPASSRRAFRRRRSSRRDRRRRSATTTPRRCARRSSELVDFDLLNAARCASRSARSTCAAATSSTSTARARRIDVAPRHGQRRAAAGLSADRDRRRVLLGRRHRLQHAAAVRARRARPAADALVFQVDLFAARGEMPAQPGRGERAREGHPLLEPDPTEHDRTSCAARRRCRRRGGCSPRLPAEPARRSRRRSCSPPCRARRRSTSSTSSTAASTTRASRRTTSSRAPSMLEHWAAGLADTQTTLEDPRWLGARAPRPRACTCST